MRELIKPLTKFTILNLQFKWILIVGRFRKRFQQKPIC